MRLRNAHALLLAASISFANSCSSGGDSTSDSPSTTSFAVTDAASDVVESFTLDILGVSLTAKSGTVSTLLETPVNVDLASLDDTSEVLATRSIPAGLYDTATVTIDLTHARCVLAGQTQPATLEDGDGNPSPGIIALPIDLRANPFHAKSGQHHLLELDFDLNQMIAADVGTNVVSIEPALALHPDPTAHKKLVVFARLADVDVAGSRFVAELSNSVGSTPSTITATVGAATIWQIDGKPDLGSKGLASLAALAVGTPLQIYGLLDPSSPKFAAQNVEAGLGTEGGSDVIDGHIVDRVGGAGADAVLTILGNSHDAANGTFQFATMFSVTTSFASSQVLRRFSAQAFSTDDLDIGQRVRVFGPLNGTVVDASAANTVIREMPTNLYGHTLVQNDASSVAIDLARVDLEPETLFSWQDGGTPPADPHDFHVALDASGGVLTQIGAPVEARGFVSGVADSSSDASATEFTDLTDSPSLLLIRNHSDGFTLTTTVTTTSISFDITGTASVGEIAILDQGFAGVRSLMTGTLPIVVPATSSGLYTLRDETTGAVSAFDSFADFSDELAVELSHGAAIAHFSAVGLVDDAQQQLAATSANAVIH